MDCSHSALSLASKCSALATTSSLAILLSTAHGLRQEKIRRHGERHCVKELALHAYAYGTKSSVFMKSKLHCVGYLCSTEVALSTLLCCAASVLLCAKETVWWEACGLLANMIDGVPGSRFTILTVVLVVMNSVCCNVVCCLCDFITLQAGKIWS